MSLKLLSKIGEKRFRSLPLIRSVCFHLSRGASELNVKQISNCLYAANRLSYKEPVSHVILKSPNCFPFHVTSNQLFCLSRPF